MNEQHSEFPHVHAEGFEVSARASEVVIYLGTLPGVVLSPQGAADLAFELNVAAARSSSLERERQYSMMLPQAKMGGGGSQCSS